MCHFVSRLFIELVNSHLFLMINCHSVIFAVKLVILKVSDEITKRNAVLLPHEIQLARLCEIQLNEPLFQVQLLLLVAELEDAHF